MRPRHRGILFSWSASRTLPAVPPALNVSFPIDRARELVARGVLGGLGPNHYSFMGALRDPALVASETGPEVGRRLRAEGVDAALDLLSEPEGPVLRELPDDAEPGDQPPAPAQASAIAPAVTPPDDPAMETTQMSRYHEQWLARSGGRTAFGLTGIPATRLRGVVRFLQRFAAAEDADMAERPADVALPGFIRWCADDLKALYVEDHLAMKPGAGGEEIARWFWGETGWDSSCVVSAIDSTPPTTRTEKPRRSAGRSVLHGSLTDPHAPPPHRGDAGGYYFEAVRLERSKRRWGSRRGDQRSPSLARRAGTLSMRKSSIAIPRATSSHVTGVETLARG